MPPSPALLRLRSSIHGLSLVAALAMLSVIPSATARLGETEAQSQTRYGAPKPELIGASEQPLMVGAKEAAYESSGWRIRVAFVNGVAVRMEYAKIPDASGLKKLTDDEVQTVLQAEKGTLSWREEKPRTGFAGLNQLQTALEGKVWERSDHAMARFKAGLILVVESRNADDLEKKQAKQAAKSTPAATTAKPNF
jgi:hypothetical protein